MSDEADTSASRVAALPEPLTGRRRNFSAALIWLVPLLAVVVALSLAIHGWLQAGPQITITFESAQGLQAGKTLVKYKNVVIGRVDSIDLSEDRDNVLVSVRLDKSAAGFATTGSRFWVVRPRIGLGGISGLGTLLSGAYIGADTSNESREQRSFTGLETPPPLTHGENGNSFVLHSPDLGSLDIGSPIYYRNIQVGRVVAYKLDKDGSGVTLQVFIQSPNDRFVKPATRFWNASGIDVSLGAAGLKVKTESLSTLVAGGIAFSTPASAGAQKPAAKMAQFHLFDSQRAAFTPPDGAPVSIHMQFDQSVRGLAEGAAVDFLGINLGEVTGIALDYDADNKRYRVNVSAVVYPSRMGTAVQTEGGNGKAAGQPGSTDASEDIFQRMVKRGLRAQLRNGNLITGQLYVALDFLAKGKAGQRAASGSAIAVPTVPGSFGKLQEQITQIADKLSQIPFDQIGKNLNESVAGIEQLLKQFNTQLAPKARQMLEEASTTFSKASKVLSTNSPLQNNMGQTLEEVRRAARSLRVLMDYLERHPESLIRGKGKVEPVPAPPQGGKS